MDFVSNVDARSDRDFMVANIVVRQRCPGTSAPQPRALRIVGRRQADGRGAGLAEKVELERLAVARQVGRHVAERDAPADAVAVAAGGDVADRLVAAA